MKTLYLLIAVTLTSFCFAQNKKNILDKFDTSGMSTNVLIQESPLINLDNYNKKNINTYQFYQAYKAIALGDLQQRFQPLQTLKQKSKKSYFTSIIPIAILLSDYETITPEAFKTNKVSQDAQGYLVRNTIDSTIFKRHNLSLAAPLRTKHKGLQTTFNISSSSIYNNTGQTIEKITIDFKDGLGFRTIELNKNISITYNEPGEKILEFKIKLETGDFIISKSKITINYSNQDLQNQFNRIINTFTSTTIANLSAYGESNSYPGVGEYEVFLSPDNVLDKPIFLVDGFDPNDGRDITGIYNLLNFEENGTTSNLGDLVRTEGFDIVILNFPEYTRTVDNALIDGGVDYIERNAMLLVDLITLINSQKVGNKQNVVIGPSMGGLISRYALNYMENQSLNHDTRLWISFDSPHQGANVPIGFQHQFNYLAYGLNDFWFIGNQNVEELQPVIDGMLKSSAARQMLTDQLEAHFVSNDPEEVEFNQNLVLPQAHPFKAIFYSNINALTTSGFPQNSRNVSIINGSGINARYPDVNGVDILPGRQILNTTFNVATGTDATLKVNLTPSADTSIEVSSVYIDFAWYIPAFDVSSSTNSKAYIFSDGIDASSGGLFDLQALAAGFDTSGLIGEFLNNLQTNYFNFIPSVSAMALNTNPNINWFQNINLGAGDTPWDGVTITNSQTPFVNWYMPDDNEPHVTLTTGNVTFALDEILMKADLSAKVVLQGAALNPNTGEENLMRDDLRASGLLPTTSPFADAISIISDVFNLGGISGIGTTENNIVDWVWVELRDANDNTSVITGKSALLQRDGDIVDIDGLSSLAFEVPGTNYYVAVKHRNHLGIITSTPIALSRITTNLNFSDASNPVTFGMNAQTNSGMPSNTLAMWAGNVNGDSTLQYTGANPDSPNILSLVLNAAGNFLNLSTYSVNGYHSSDINMDGNTQYTGTEPDTPIILQNALNHSGNFLNLSTFSIEEQLPEN